MSKAHLNSAPFQLLIGAFLIGLAPIFVRFCDLGPAAIGAYRCGFGALILGVIILFKNSPAKFDHKNHHKTFYLLTILAGFIFSLDLYVWHHSIEIVGAGISTLLANTQVIHLSLLGIILHKDRPRPLFIFSVFLSLFGIALLVNFHEQGMQVSNYKIGMVLGLATGIIYASYTFLLRYLKSVFPGIPLIHILFFISLFTSIVMFGISATEGTFQVPDIKNLLVLFLLGLVAQVAGWLIIANNLPKVSLGLAGLILLAQPLFSTLLGVIIFGEPMNIYIFTGVILTITGIYLGGPKTSSKLSKAELAKTNQF